MYPRERSPKPEETKRKLCVPEQDKKTNCIGCPGCPADSTLPIFDLNSFEVKFRQPGMSINNMDQKQDDWFWILGGITIDSGAAESVMPTEMCPNYPQIEGPQ